LNKDKN